MTKEINGVSGRNVILNVGVKVKRSLITGYLQYFTALMTDGF